MDPNNALYLGEMLEHILKNLDFRSALIAAQVSWQWKAITDGLWKF